MNGAGVRGWGRHDAAIRTRADLMRWCDNGMSFWPTCKTSYRTKPTRSTRIIEILLPLRTHRTAAIKVNTRARSPGGSSSRWAPTPIKDISDNTVPHHPTNCGGPGNNFRRPARPLGSRKLLILFTIVGIALSAFPATVLASGSACYSRGNYALPHSVQAEKFTLAGVPIPLGRQEVHVRTMDQLNYLLMDRRALMMEWFDHMALFGPTIRKTLAEESVPEDLIYLAVLVSDLLPATRTRTGGVGWWSLVTVKEKKNQSTSQWVSTSEWDDRRDPVLSTRIACGILKKLVQRGSNADWLMAMCAYVDGTDKIDEVVKKAPGFSYWDLVMPSYSESLIPRLVALKIVDMHRSFYSVDVPPLPPLVYDYLDRLKLLKDLPLHVVAKWCNVTPRAVWELNPGVDPSSGFLPKADKKYPTGFPLRVPKDVGHKVRHLLVSEGYLPG